MTSSLKLPVKKYRYFSKTKSKKKHDAKFTFKFLIKIPLLPVSLHFFFYLTCYCKIFHSWIRILIQEGKSCGKKQKNARKMEENCNFIQGCRSRSFFQDCRSRSHPEPPFLAGAGAILLVRLRLLLLILLLLTGL